MQRFIIVCIFVVTMYTLIGCASHQGSQLDTSRDLKDIRKVLTQWQQAYQEKDVNRYLMLRAKLLISQEEIPRKIQRLLNIEVEKRMQLLTQRTESYEELLGAAEERMRR